MISGGFQKSVVRDRIFKRDLGIGTGFGNRDDGDSLPESFWGDGVDDEPITGRAVAINPSNQREMGLS